MRLCLALIGTIEIQTADGLALLVEPMIITIGESGLMTSEPRAATVVAESQVTIQWMHCKHLWALLSNTCVFRSYTIATS